MSRRRDTSSSDDHDRDFGGRSTLSKAELRDASIAGVRWIAAVRLVAELGTFASAVALARLLSPADFGHAAVALILGPLATTITFEAFGAALVQRATVDREHVGSALLGSLVVGLLLSLLTVVAAPVIGAPLFGEKTAGLLQLMAPAFIVGAVSAVSRATLMRSLDFRRLGLAEVGGLLPGALVAVIAAAAGVGAAALVIGYLFTLAMQSALMLFAATPQRPRISRRALREISGFGAPAALAGITTNIRRNLDYVILGIQVSPAQLGIYYRAFQIGAEYQQKVSTIIVRMILPVYSRASSPDDVRAIHGKVTRLHAVIIFPLLGILIAVAPVLVPWLFGDQWRAAVVPTQILAVAGMASTLLAGHAEVLVAAGRPRALLNYNLGSIAGYGAVLFVVAPYGLAVTAAGVAVAHIVMLLAVYVFLFDRLVGIPLRMLTRAVLPALTAAIAVVLVGMAAVELSGGLPASLVIAGTSALCLATYAAVLRVAFGDTWRELRSLAARLRKRPASPASPGLSEEVASG